MLSVLLFIVAGWLTLGTILTIGTVGKKREPITPGVAVISTISGVFTITIIVLAALQLNGI